MKYRNILTAAILIAWISGLYMYISIIGVQGSEESWDTCNGIDNKESEAYFECLERFHIGGYSKDHRNYYINQNIVIDVILLGLITGFFIVPLIVFIEKLYV